MSYPVVCVNCGTTLHEIRYQQSADNPPLTDPPLGTCFYEVECTCTQCGAVSWHDPELIFEAQSEYIESK
ncbi:hypothetical protein [Photobacterium lipolyticum]|nr:hypothetical protein [Photobacterium lipolyticum]